MKKIMFILFPLLILTSCTTTNVQKRDDFRSVSENQKSNFLKEKKATDKNRSVLLFTQGFKGEKVTAVQNGKSIYSSYPISNLKTNYADSFSFDNTKPLNINDSFSKTMLTITPKQAKNHKFIYVMKQLKNDKTIYKVTLSNTLRPLK